MWVTTGRWWNTRCKVSHRLWLTLALCLKVGTNRENTGVKKRSKPAIKAHLLAEVSEMPHCWNPDPQKFISPNSTPQNHTVRLMFLI